MSTSLSPSRNIQKLECLAIWSENPHKLAKWYQDTFDLMETLRLDEPDDTGVGFEFGELLLWFGFHSEVHGKNKDPFRMILEFKVKDLKEIYQRLKKVKATIIRQPSYANSIKCWIITAHDPEGNTIQFFSDTYEK